MSTLLQGVPREDGFRMPGEQEPQSAVLMAWPERSDNWREHAAPAQQAFIDVARAIAEETPVIMCVSAAQYSKAREILPAEIQVLEVASNDCWMRDIGPTYVVNDAGQLRGIDWQFNAWGGKVNGLYQDFSLDDAMPETLLTLRGEDRYRAPLVLEGGSIHVDGQGTLITTDECLLHPGRNPQLSKEGIAELLCLYLGVSKVIWIPRGLYNDETDGHIDNILHFIRPTEVALTWCDDPGDPVYDICRECLSVLQQQTDARGRKFVVHKLPLPGPLYLSAEEAAGITQSEGMARMAGERLAASYANFLITNNRVVFPLLDAEHDEEARQVFQRLFPAKDIVGVPGHEIILGGGNIHCITQQIPVAGAG